LAFTIGNGIEYVKTAVKAGLKVDDIGWLMEEDEKRYEIEFTDAIFSYSLF